MLEWSQVDATFIISTGRTGTRFLADKLSKYANHALVHHEPQPNLQKEAFEYYSQGKVDSDYCALFKMNRLNMLDELRSLGRSTYIESNGGITFMLPHICSLFKSCNVIHIVRDPRTWIPSAYSRTQIRNGKSELKYLRDSSWVVSPQNLENDPYRNRWQNMNLIERLSWIWEFKNRYVLDKVASDCETLMLRYEDVFEALDCDSKKKILEVCQVDLQVLSKEKILEDFNDKINQTSKFELDNYLNWAKDDVLKCDAIVTQLRNRFYS
ncbi:hypothetical protein ACMZOO_14020 [Catenovulum sp. SX2]|uniref:hypothetical protein n=1 Tax=Catenovulum sp. SX2 TaxID=3398614 RepID=UPI003F862078